MAQQSTDRLEKQRFGLRRSGDRLVYRAMVASALTSSAVMAAQTAAPPLTVEAKQPIPVNVAYYPPSPQYLAFRGEIWEAKGHLDKVFGVVDEAAYSAWQYTELEDWQHNYAFFDGRLNRGPGVVKDTLFCPKLSTPVDLIKGRQSMERDPSDQDRIRRMEALLNTCQPASGIFHPLAVLKRWERDGWVWTALKAQDSNGKIVSLLHNAPKLHVTP